MKCFVRFIHQFNGLNYYLSTDDFYIDFLSQIPRNIVVGINMPNKDALNTKEQN